MVIYNSILPVKGFIALSIYPFIFVRKEYKGKLTKYTINHEKIHHRQQLEHLIILFFIIYLIEYIFEGYRDISFEREAYNNAQNLDYLKHRKLYANYKYWY